MKVSDMNFRCNCFGRRGTREIPKATYLLKAVIFIRKVLAPVRPWLKSKRLLPCPETVQEAQNSDSRTCLKCTIQQVAPSPGPSSPSVKFDEDWLILQTSGLEEVRAVSTSLEGTLERILSLVLEGIGLLGFLNDVWRWQEVDICQAFVLHWDHKTKTTEVFGIQIDASYRNFLLLTGLDATNDQTMQEDGREGTTKVRPVDYHEDVVSGSKPISYSLLDDVVLLFLFRVLNSTLWFSENPSNFPPKDMVHLLFESIKGEKVNWSKSVYEKFIHEIRELQDCHGNHPNEKLQTLAGPLMCFLYSQVKCNAEASVNAMIPMRKTYDMRCSISPRAAGRWVELEEKNQYEYYDGEVEPWWSHGEVAMVPPGCRPPPLNVFPRQESTSTKIDGGESFQTELEDEISNTMQSEGVEVQLTADMNATLIKIFEEQKRKQERFKLHLRSTWLRPFSAPCSFGCCDRPIYSPEATSPSLRLAHGQKSSTSSRPSTSPQNGS